MLDVGVDDGADRGYGGGLWRFQSRRTLRLWLGPGAAGWPLVARAEGPVCWLGAVKQGVELGKTRWDRDALYASKTLAPPKQGPARLEVEVPGSSRPGLRPHDKDQGDSSISLLTNTATEDNALTLANLLI